MCSTTPKDLLGWLCSFDRFFNFLLDWPIYVEEQTHANLYTQLLISNVSRIGLKVWEYITDIFIFCRGCSRYNYLLYFHFKKCCLFIGETQQLLHTRVKNHRTTESSVLHQHIQTCSTYQQSFFNVLIVDQDNSTQKQQLDFF
jgi:hypothetical protein